MKSGFLVRLRRDMGRNWALYLLAIPMVLFYIIFCYGPIYGQIIAFKDFSPALGIMDLSLIHISEPTRPY